MSEWKVDEHGKRYRLNGSIREYEKIIVTSYGNIPESQLEEVTRQARAAEKAAREREVKRQMEDAARGTLIQVAQACKDGQGNVMRAWDSISQVADYCSGQAHGRREKPGYVISMGEKWEQLATEAIDNF